MSLLYHLNLILSKQKSKNPTDLDEPEPDDTITSNLEKIPDEGKEMKKTLQLATTRLLKSSLADLFVQLLSTKNYFEKLHALC